VLCSFLGQSHFAGNPELDFAVVPCQEFMCRIRMIWAVSLITIILVPLVQRFGNSMDIRYLRTVMQTAHAITLISLP
jgi:hypothetical protein